ITIDPAGPNADWTLRFYAANGGAGAWDSGQQFALRAGRRYLLLWCIIANVPHLSVCEVGGVAEQFTNGTNISSVLSGFNGAPLFEVIGGARHTTAGDSVERGYVGEISDVFALAGTFPNTGGTPSGANIETLARGVLTPDALADAIGAQRISYYPLTTPETLDNAWNGVAGASGAPALSIVGHAPDSGHYLLRGDQLRPSGIAPAPAGDLLSDPGPMPTTGDITSWRGDVAIQGGTFDAGLLSGTLSDVEARLVHEDGAAVAGADWTVIDAAPSGGVFSGHVFAGLTPTPGWWQAEYRARDAGGTVLATATASALRGVGPVVVFQSQSQGVHLFDSEAEAGVFGMGGTPGAGTRMAVSELTDELGGADELRLYTRLPCAGQRAQNTPRGVSVIADEWNARFPGYPIQIVKFCTPGHALAAYANDLDTTDNGQPGSDGFRIVSGWLQTMADQFVLSLSGRHIRLHYGHSADSQTGYDTKLDDLQGRMDAILGPSLRDVHVPVQRNLATPGTQIPKRQVVYDRALGDARSVVLAHAGDVSVQGDDIHPATASDAIGEKGVPRAALQIGWGILFAHGAVEGAPVILTDAARVSGTTATLTFGAAPV
ncbi:MAG: hypothetical protein AAF264_06425, partial [Pseudomonadota bacterium]